MFYCTRYLHNPDRETEYYIGNGKWVKKDFDRCLIRFYDREAMAKYVIKDLTEADWHKVEILK